MIAYRLISIECFKAHRAAGDCSLLKTTPSKGPPRGEIFLDLDYVDFMINY